MICWLISCLCLPGNRGSPTKPVSLKIVSLSFCLRRKKRDGNIWDHRVHCWIATIEASHMWNRPLHSSFQHSHAQDFLGQPHGPLYNSGLQAKAQVWSWFLLHLIHQILSDSPPTHILDLSAVCLPVTSTLPLVTYSILLAFSPVCWEYRRATSNYVGAGDTNTGLHACVVSIFIHRAISPSLCALVFI